MALASAAGGDGVVLVVDDNVEFASLLGTLLSEQGLVPLLAHSGQDALAVAQHHPIQALILDLLLPDMTGHRLLSSLPRSERCPVFVITGVFKGQSQQEKLQTIARLAGWFEKPFDTRLLVEQVARAIGQVPVIRQEHKSAGQITGDFDISILEPVEFEGLRAPKSSSGVPPLAPPDDVEVEVEMEPSGDLLWKQMEAATPNVAIDSADLLRTTSENASIFGELRRNEAGELEVRPVVPPPDLLANAATDVFASRLSASTPPTALELSPALEPVGPLRQEIFDLEVPLRAAGSGAQDLLEHFEEDQTVVADRPPAPPRAPPARAPSVARPEALPSPEAMRTGLRSKMRAGALRNATVPRLLTAFYIARETGEIVFERGTERKIVYFSEGRPVNARSNQDSDRLGAVARKAFGLNHDKIERALELARKNDRMLGEVLIELGFIEPNHRGDLLREQTRAIILSLLGWAEGRYVIGFLPAQQILRAALDEHPAALVLAGAREVFDLARLRRLVPDRAQPMPSPNPPYELSDLPLSDAEALLVLHATGSRSVGQLLLELAGAAPEQTLRACLHALLSLGVLVPAQSVHPTPGSRAAGASGTLGRA